MAVAAGRDHLEFLLEQLGEPRWLGNKSASSLNTERAINVIKKVADKGDWGKPLHLPASFKQVNLGPYRRIPFLLWQQTRALKKLNAPPVKLASLAKKEELIYLQDNLTPVKLPRNSPVLKLLQ